MSVLSRIRHIPGVSPFPTASYASSSILRSTNSYWSRISDTLGLTPKESEQKPSATVSIDSVLKARLPCPISESSRLKDNPRIKQTLQTISHAKLNPAQELAVMQSIELQDKLKGFFVINHGQSNSGLVINIASKKLSEIFDAKKYKHFEVLRHPIFLKHIQKEQDVHWVKEKMQTGYDSQYRDELICGDIYLEHTAPNESAIAFLSSSTSIALALKENFKRNTLDKIVGVYPVDKKLATELSGIGDSLKGGSLYSICIPKEKFSSMGFLSKAYGTPTDWKYHKSDLDYIQKGYVPSKAHDYGQPPQVRLLANKLTPEEGVFIIPHTTLDTTQLKDLEDQVESCIRKNRIS